jgi:hypothetical protein
MWKGAPPATRKIKGVGSGLTQGSTTRQPNCQASGHPPELRTEKNNYLQSIYLYTNTVAL